MTISDKFGDGSMASFSPPDEQYATTPCWPRLDKILRDLLAWLHHALGSDVLAPGEAAGQFSNHQIFHPKDPRQCCPSMYDMFAKDFLGQEL